MVAVSIAASIFVAALSLALLKGAYTDASAGLYVFPVALLAVTFGRSVGVAAGMLGVVLIAVEAIVQDGTLTPIAWVAQALPMLILGALLGDASDRLRWAEIERRRLEAGALLHREAIEINDSLVQGMAAARWSLEASSRKRCCLTCQSTQTAPAARFRRPC